MQKLAQILNEITIWMLIVSLAFLLPTLLAMLGAV